MDTASYGGLRLFGRCVFLPKGTNQFLYRENFVDPEGVLAGKSKTVFQFAPLGVTQGDSDAVRALGVVAGFDAVVWTFEGFGLPLADPADELIADGPSRQSHRTFNHHQVIFRGVHESLLEGFIGIAFMRGHKAGAHLHTGSAEFEEFMDVDTGENAAGGNYGNGFF